MAMGLYLPETIVVLIAAVVIMSEMVGPTPGGLFLGCLFIVLSSLTAN